MIKSGLILIAFLVFLTIPEPLVVEAGTCKCGTNIYNDVRDFVISGTPVEDTSIYPFMVTLNEPTKPFLWNGCGGAIISPTFILTAAHCIQKLSVQNSYCRIKMTRDCYASPYDMKIGVFNDSTYWPTMYVEIKQFIPHPEYESGYYTNDIALVELKNPLRCTKHARPICIRDTLNVKIGDLIHVLGYGRMSAYSQMISHILREGIMHVIQYSYCRRGRDPTVLCAVGETQSICEGDSGTIAFVKKKGRYIGVGVTSSHTDDNCKLGKPATFMDIYFHYSFIREHVYDLPKY